ncbi:MAG: Crp/Fnr family transcriptional regulator [Anaerolineae bacterium]|nr:Crp/Fnr family transcriptional regulator [Anaerolineae bacterium]
MAVSIDTLRAVSILNQTVPDDLEMLADLMVKRTYAPGELIFLEGEQASGVWFILDGKVKIVKIGSSGRIQALCIASTGKCFGTCPLFNQNGNPANAQALTEVTLLMLPQADLEHLMTTNTRLVWVLLKIYSQYLGQLARLSESLGSLSVGDRINDVLLTHADAQLVVMLTHEKLAELAGTVREVVSRHLAELADQNLIQLEFGRIQLLNPTGLRLPCLSK